MPFIHTAFRWPFAKKRCLFPAVLGSGFQWYGYWVSEVPGIRVWVSGFG